MDDTTLSARREMQLINEFYQGSARVHEMTAFYDDLKHESIKLSAALPLQLHLSLAGSATARREIQLD